MHLPVYFPRLLPGAVLLISLSACMTAGPDYQEPALTVPAGWVETQAASSQESMLYWWRRFNDPMLDALVEQVLHRNQDLDIALARLRQARAERIQVASAAGPTVSADGLGQARRDSKAMAGQPGGESRSWRLGFDASWELDLFGGTRRAIEAADACIDALEHDHRALQLSLIAELLNNYAGLRAAQVRLAIARDNVRTLTHSEALAEQAQRSGLGTSADVMQARAERATAQAQPPLLDAEIARFSHAIAVLAGGFPGDGHSALLVPGPMMNVAADLPLSLPSEVIRQRPDLRADERRLAQATAQIGVADAQRFPSFSIPLGLGTTASVIHSLFSGASLAWTAAIQADQLVYDGGRSSAGVSAARANADAARLVYERDVRVAMQDVEDALTILNSQRQRQLALRQALADSQAALQQATRLYRAGLSAYLTVLVAQRSVNQAQDSLASSQLADVQGLIALHKALGVGLPAGR